MTSIILQPYGDKIAREHYADSVEVLVALTRCESRVSKSVFQQLQNAHPSGSAALWGVTPGTNNVNRNKWEKIQVGDLALFSRDGGIKATAIVTAKFHSPRLAVELWDRDADGDTWEYMYALDEVRNVDIAYPEFNAIVGYKDNYIIQGFNVLDSEKSIKFLDRFEYWSETHVPEITELAFNEALTGLDGELDQKVQGWRRTEQSKARNRLLRGATTGTCLFCNRKINAEFLIAAHIKRRADCNNAEKRDIDNNMMLACKFGCDDLFEKGCISVDEEGHVVVSSKLVDKVAREHSNVVVKKIERKKEQAIYLEWHFEERFLR